MKARLGCPRVEIRAVVGHSSAVAGVTPIVLAGDDLGSTDSARRFALARLCAAASRPRLAAGLVGPAAAVVEDILDRFAAAAYPEPRGAFEVVGDDPIRRRRVVAVWLAPKRG